MSELPPGWVFATVGEVTSYVSRGKSPKYAEKSALPVVNQRAIRWFGIQREHLKFIHPEQIPQWTDERFIRVGDVLWNSTGTGTIGRACLVSPEHLTPPKVVDSHVTIVRPQNTVIEPRYLFAWIRGPEVQDRIEGLATGTTNQIELSRGTIVDTRIPLAPLPEQKRIADKLDSLFTRVDACRERLDRIPKILERCRQSVLSAATSGELTREWREENGIDGDWPEVDLASVATSFSYGSAAKSSKVGKVPVLRMGNIQNGQLDWEDLVFTSDAAEIDKYKLSSGDVLFNRTNSPELVGKTAVFRGEREAIYAGYLIRVRCSKHLCPDYLNYCLGSPAGREYCRQVKSDGVSQSNINARKLAAFKFGLPSLEEQREIIRSVEELLSLIGAFGIKSRRATMLVEHLTSSALAKAFRGELVPQDPADEPASEFLTRLGGALPAADTHKLPKKASARKAVHAPKESARMTKSRQDEDVKDKPYLARHLRALGGSAMVEALFKASELPIADFYKQLAWEVDQGFVRGNENMLETSDAA